MEATTTAKSATMTKIHHLKQGGLSFANENFKLGYRLAFGRGKKKDWQTIVRLWANAAEAGHAQAMFYLGTCYDFGKGVKPDPDLAFKWYSRALA